MYILLFVDALSKFPVAFPLKTKEMAGVAECLWRVISLFGAPVALHSDNGKEFVNEVVDELASVHGINRRLITAYRPQANGQVERFNRVVQAIMRKCTEGAEDMWPEWLEYVMLAIRTATSATTGHSPFQVMFGRDFHPLVNYAIVDWEQLVGTPQVEGDEQAVAGLMARRSVDRKSVV